MNYISDYTTIKNYSDMINYCCGDKIILNNDIIKKLSCKKIFFEQLNGVKNIEIYQYYIITKDGAKKLQKLTNEIVLYNDFLNIYIILGVTHFGTNWSLVSSNWKK